MGFHLKGKPLFRVFALKRIFPCWKDCGMIVSQRRLGWCQRLENKEVMVTMPYLVKQRRGRGKGPDKGKKKSEEPTSQPRKDLSKFKWFMCHKLGHYASQCLEKKKGKGKQ